MIKRIDKEKIALIVFFTALLIMFFFVPLNHDEWAWGSSKGMADFQDFFQDLNGRYFGDIIALFIPRSVIFKTLFMTGSVIALFASIKRFLTFDIETTESKRLISWVTLVLLMLVPYQLFREIYGWPAAFVNFLPPAIFLVALLHQVDKRLIRNGNRKNDLIVGMGLALGTQFFSENISIYMVVFSFFLLIFELVKYRKISRFSLGVTLISVLGTAIMFANPAYSQAFGGTDGYKSVTWSFDFFWNKLYAEMLPNMLFHYKYLLIFFTILVCTLFFRSFGKKTFFDWFTLFYAFLFVVYANFFYGNMVFTERFYHDLVNIFSFGYFFALLYLFCRFIPKEQLTLILVTYISIVFTAGPLMVANPIGTRSFYSTYILWILLCGLLLKIVIKEVTLSKAASVNITRILKLTIGATMIFYLAIFSYIYKIQLIRYDIIAEAKVTKPAEVEIPMLPNEKYYYQTSAKSKIWRDRFAEYYGLPDGTNVVFKKK